MIETTASKFWCSTEVALFALLVANFFFNLVLLVLTYTFLGWIMKGMVVIMIACAVFFEIAPFYHGKYRTRLERSVLLPKELDKNST